VTINVPPTPEPCTRFAWCARQHGITNLTSHFGSVARYSGLTITAHLEERPGAGPNRWIRMIFQVNGSRRMFDITPQDSLSWADLLSVTDVRELSAIAQTLYRAGVTLEAGR
jgi:hypothetical protein